MKKNGPIEQSQPLPFPTLVRFSGTAKFAVLILIQIIVSINVYALSKEDLIFSVSFDKGFDADNAGGGGAAKVEGSVVLVPNDNAKELSGRNGTKAAKFIKKGDLLRYALAGNVNLPQGAISLWVYELDTQPAQRVWNPYFQIAGQDETLNVLRLWQPIFSAGGLWRSGQKVSLAGGNAVEVPGTGAVGSKPREWQHLLFTWRKHEMAMYVNGARSESTDNVDFVFVRPPESFTLGRPANPTTNADSFHTGEHMLKDVPAKAAEMKIGTEPYGAYLLDDVAIFNRFLGPEEAVVIFRNSLAEALASGAKGEPKLTLRNFTSIARVRVDADFGERLPENVDIKAVVRKTDGSPAKVNTDLKVTPGGLDYGFLDVQKLAPGNYDVVVMATQNGKVVAKTPVARFERAVPEAWMTNTYGQEDIVLKGFEPLKAAETTVTLWGRTYEFGNAIMPVQIVNQGHNMLARPINWHARIGGKDYSLATAAMKLVSASETRACYEGRGTLGGLSVTAKVLVEYDGFMKFDLAFAPGAKPVEIEKLWMDIPLVPAQSTNLFHPCRRSGVWDKDWKSPLTLIFTNIVTLGTPDISLQWLTESDEHYYPAGNKEALATFDEKDARVFRNSVIAAAKTVAKPFSLTFALHAGPVRERPQNWRGWTINGRRYLDPKRDTSVRYDYFQGFWSRAPGDLIPREDFPAERLKNRIDATSMHFGGFRAFTEKDPQKRLPEWQKYESEWVRVPTDIVAPTCPGWANEYVDTNSSWSQWHAYNCYKLFSKTGFRGLYYDDWMPGVSMNEAVGSGYVDENGIRHGTYPIFSQRELHRRVYSIVKQFRPDDGIVIMHTASSILLPIVSFCDVIYDGEIMGWTDLAPPKGNYFQTFRDDLFQMIFSCKNYGPVGGFHDMTTTYLNRPDLYPDMAQVMTMANQRKLWAKWLMHDIHTYGGFTGGGEELLYFYLDNAFDLRTPDVTFYPYWASEPAVRAIKGYWTSEGKKVPDLASKYLASAYSKSNGQALVIVVRDAPDNYGPDPVTVEVQLDRKKLGLPEGALVSLELESLGRNTKGVIEGDVLKVPVGVDDFSAVIVKGNKKALTK